VALALKSQIKSGSFSHMGVLRRTGANYTDSPPAAEFAMLFDFFDFDFLS